MNIGVIYTLTLSMLLLTSCINMSGIFPVSQTKNANALKAEKAFSSAEKNVTWPEESWWESYNDPQLDQLIRQTISGNPSLRIAENRATLAQAYIVGAHAALLPSVGVDASTGLERFTARQFVPAPWAGHADWNNQITTNLAYDLDLWGSKQSVWKGYIDEAKASQAEVQQVKLSLITSVVRNYIELSIAYELRDIANERLSLREKNFDIAHRALTGGIGTEINMIEAEIPLSTIRGQVEIINKRIVLIGNQISGISGQGPDAGLEITRPKMIFNASIGLPSLLPANLIGRRPDLLANRWRIKAAANDIESAKADFYPNINLLAFVGFQALGFSQVIGNSSLIAGVGPAISLPIFDGGRRRGNLSVKTAEYDIAVEKYNATLINALQEVSSQLVIFQSNAKQISEVEIGLALLKKSCALAEKSYQAGLENYQKVIDAKVNLLAQRELEAYLQGERLGVYAELMQSLGGGIFDEESNRRLHERAKSVINVDLGTHS